MIPYDRSGYGRNGFFHFFGVVEDRMDPLNLGRVRVRCYGWHNDDLSAMPTDSLPWALVGMPTTSASVSGLGCSPSGLVEGSMVFGFFIDGIDAQQPVVMMSFPGIPAEVAKSFIGFNDSRRSTAGFPVNALTQQAMNYPFLADEPDSNRIARNENTGDSILNIKTYGDSVTAADGSTHSQPASGYQAKFPFNHVYQSESGHFVEFDDTPGAERVTITHRSGSFRDVLPNGTRNEHVVGLSYEKIDGDDVLHVHGAKHVVVDGAMTVKVTGNAMINVGGSATVTANGTTLNSNLQVNGTITATGDVVAGSISLQNHVHSGVQTGGGLTGPAQG